MTRLQILLYYCILLWLLVLMNHCVMEKIRYISLERPLVLYTNEKYVKFFNATARRYFRSDPHYYFTGYGTTLIPLDNNITVDFYFYEFSSNTYKRTFFKLQFKFCDLINGDKFLGAFFSHGTVNTCPLPPGTYNVVNSTISTENVPDLLILQKGRILANVTYRTGEPLIRGSIDIEMKERHGRSRNNK